MLCTFRVCSFPPQVTVATHSTERVMKPFDWMPAEHDIEHAENGVTTSSYVSHTGSEGHGVIVEVQAMGHAAPLTAIREGIW